MNNRNLILIPERIESKIFFIRRKKVMLDRDLAQLYGVENRALNQAVKRNLFRFPTDFMFQLTKVESKAFSRSQFVTLENSNLKSQSVTSRNPNLKYQIGTSSYGGRRKLPFAFTEQGVAMLSSVLNSKQAIQVNIQIIRTFTKLRELIASNRELRLKIEKLENKYDQHFKVVFDAIRKFFDPPKAPPQKIGFRVYKENRHGF